MTRNICYCDRCGTVIDEPETVCFPNDNNHSAWIDVAKRDKYTGKLDYKTLDLCQACTEQFYNWLHQV